MVTLHISSPGIRLTMLGNQLQIHNDEDTQSYGLSYVKSIYIHSGINLTADVILKSHNTKTQLIFCRKGGMPIASLHTPAYFQNAGQVFQQLCAVGTDWAKAQAAEWIIQKWVARTDLLEGVHDKTNNAIFQKARLHHSMAISNLGLEELGYEKVYNNEGWISKSYFKAFALALPRQLYFSKRSRLPAQDFTNAILNYLYGILYKRIENIICIEGLDPHIGFHHSMVRKDKAFLFDFIECFRCYAEGSLLYMAQDLIQHIPPNYIPNVSFNGALRKTIILKFQEYLQQEKFEKQVYSFLKVFKSNLKKQSVV